MEGDSAIIAINVKIAELLPLQISGRNSLLSSAYSAVTTTEVIWSLFSSRLSVRWVNEMRT